jgi:hypothetical protein
MGGIIPRMSLCANIRQIKNAIRTAQAMVSFNHESLSYTLLKDILGTVGDFGDLDGA